ncbi:MAG: transporter [Candidatus Acidiferrales bacterium]
MNGLRNFQAYVLACSLVVIWQPLQGLAQSDPGAPVAASVRQQGAAQRDGQHDFDFEIGTWKTHLSRRLHPLTGSTTWVEYDGTSVVRKIWGGRANLVELDVTGPAGHVEALSLRLYDPVTHQWSLNSANVRVGTLSVPTIGEFKNGRGEFYDQEPFNGRTILVRNVWSEITADSCHFEQAFSEDGGKSWEVNWIAVDKRVKDDSGEAAPDTTPGAALGGAPAGAQQNSALSPVDREALGDAWWTGPMLANSAATLPRGHFLIEPYLYDVIGAHSNGFGSLTYIEYGLFNRFTVGLIPTAGFNKMNDALSSSRVGLGDLSVLGQFRLRQFHEGSWLPTTSIFVEETLPTGRYDELGSRLSDGFGGGAYTTTVALNNQTYFWMRNGRILRMRFNVSQSLSSYANVEGASVYGTSAGFQGHAKPGASSFVDAAWEYSLTRKWVLALDATYRHTGNTRVTGYDAGQAPPEVKVNSGSSDAVGFAPAIEYNWKPTLGVLLGTRVIAIGHNTATTITPAVAINFVH